MFKVKTDYGFVLVEKDKIASIVPTTPLPPRPPTTKPARNVEKKSASDSAAAGASTKSLPTLPPQRRNRPIRRPESRKISADPVRPVTPAKQQRWLRRAASDQVCRTTCNRDCRRSERTRTSSQQGGLQGNLYTNFSHGFKMYKAPSWELIEDARKALPNAIVAMGTSNESTLMVVGQEPLKDSLDVSANGVEKRLREIYSNYRYAFAAQDGGRRSPRHRIQVPRHGRRTRLVRNASGRRARQRCA